MFRKEVAARPLLMWMLCASSAPAVQLLAGYDWKLLTLIGIAAAAATCLSLCWRGQWPRWLELLQAVWLVIVLAECVHYTEHSWPMAETQKIIPIALLALAAWSARKGPATAARLAGILLLFLCVGYGLVLGAGVTQINWQWVSAQKPAELPQAVFALLLPAAAVCMPRQKPGKRMGLLFCIPVFCVLATVVTCGSIHPDREQTVYAFYEMCRSLSLFGLAERFEALVCGLITVGWFSLLSFLLSALANTAQKLSPENGAIGVWGGAAVAAAVFLGNLHMEPSILAAGAVIFWVLFPLLSQGIGVAKKWIKK